MSNKTKVRKHNVTVKAALKYGSEIWVLNKIEKQHLEATQMRFLRPLLGYTKLYLQRNFGIREQLEAQKSKRNSNIPEELAKKKNTSKGCKMRSYHN
jgi:hypothetical protein